MKELSKIFKALSDPNRIRILKMLEMRHLCVCEITDILQLATSTVSKHLAVLRDAGLILDRKENKWVNFYLNDSSPKEYVRDMLPLFKKWLVDDETVRQDRERAIQVDRNVVCKT
jgi:ArsR family transcriptional regulator